MTKDHDLISRQAAIDEYGDWYVEEGTEEGFIGTVKQLLEGLPSAQPERKRGKWIEANTHIYGIYECTACKAWTYIPHEPRDYSFCPRCGADMRGEQP